MVKVRNGKVIKMDKKCVHSRAYHKAYQAAQASGESKDAAKLYARVEAKKASYIVNQIVLCITGLMTSCSNNALCL